MAPADVQLVRLSFGDMANALARGDVDAYIGAEPGPSISVLSGQRQSVALSVRDAGRLDQRRVRDAPGASSPSSPTSCAAS